MHLLDKLKEFIRTLEWDKWKRKKAGLLRFLTVPNA